jgi:ABC-type transport system involved in multi-copper enzyme maturation permease subunit
MTAATTDQKEPPMTTTHVPTRRGRHAASPSAPRPAGRLAAILRSELIKCSTVRTTKVLLAVAMAIGLLTSWAAATFVTNQGLVFSDLVVIPTLLTAVLATIAGVLSFTAEVQHGTLAGSLAAHPSRWPVAAAKALVAAGLGLLLGAVGTAAGAVGALAGGIEVGDASAVTTRLLWALLYTVGSALLGLGVGMVVRHSAGAVSGVLVWWLVVEGLLVQFASPELVRFVPFDTGARTLGLESDFDVPEVLAAGLSNPQHASIFWGYVMIALVLGTLLLRRRDVD